MLGFFQFFDAYNLRARVFPALIAGLPALALLLVVVPWDRFELSQLIAGIIALTLLWAFAHAARQAGLKVEAKIGSRATPELWHHDNSELDAITKNRFREFMSEKLGVAAPTHEIEKNDPEAANQFYAASATWLRDLTRDAKRFHILFEELITYGARRNLLGLKPVGLSMNLIVLGHNRGPGSHPALGLYNIRVNKRAVLSASRGYGRQLILSCETLMKPKAPTSRRNPTTRSG